MNSRALELVFGPSRSVLRTAIIWAIFIGIIIFATVGIWPAFKNNTEISDQIVKAMPASVVQAFGLEGFGTPAGFLRGNLYDFFIPMLIAGAGVGFANSLTSSEEDSGRLEVILAQPVTRQAVFLGRATAVFAWVVVITLFTAIVQFGSDALFDLQIAADKLVATLVLSALLALFVSGMALAIAGFRARPSLVLGIGVFVVVGGFIISALFPLSSSLAEFAHVSPWDWAFAGDPLVHGAELWRYLTLGLPAIAMTIFGVWAFGRRDVAAA